MRRRESPTKILTARYASILSRIYGEWCTDDWEYFRSFANVPNLLTVLHEAAHWMQRQTLLERALHLVTVRAFLGHATSLPKQANELPKVIACRKLLAPISEGLAIYTQFDYFPANFFTSAGKRSPYDGFLEFLVARRDFEKTSGTEAGLAETAWDALATARFSDEALQKKRRLLETPFLIGEDHITGYLLVKAIVANARCSYPFYLHDGLLLPLITSIFYNCPEMIRAILDSAVSCDDAISIFTENLRSRLQTANSQTALRDLLLQIRGTIPDFEHSVALEQDRSGFIAAQELYQAAYDGISKHIDASQAAESFTQGASENDASARGPTDEEELSPIVGFALLSSPHFGRIFTEEVTIRPEGEVFAVQLKSTGQTVELKSNSLRADVYRWIIHPDKETDGILTEAIVHLHGLDHDYFRVSLISHPKGLLVLEHNTDDYNIGHFDLALYLNNSYRADRCLQRIEEYLIAFEKRNFSGRAKVRRAKESVFREQTESVIKAIGGDHAQGKCLGGWLNGRDMFESEADFIAYIAFSLAVRFGDFAFESHRSARSLIDRQLSRFSPCSFNRAKALRFLSRRQGCCRVLTTPRYTPWYTFTCML